MNIHYRLSLAGTWIPIDPENLVPGINYGGLASTTYGHLALAGGNGMIVSGWGWTGAFGDGASLAAPEQVHVALFTPQADGTLRLATADYLASDLSNGANAVAVADFNGDGRTDIFLPAHNESPFHAEPSTLYLGNAKGGFDKHMLDDAVMAHDAQLVMLGGSATVFSATYSPGDANPVYAFAGGLLQQTIPARLSGLKYMSIAVANLGVDGAPAVVLGEVSGDPAAKGKIAVYGLDGTDLASTTPIATITPYLSLKYPELESIYGIGATHTYRVFSDDFNHDGLADLLAEESMWTSANQYPTVLQMLQNTGAGQFVDRTDALGSALSQDIQELDYQPQVLDIDGSGIASYLLAGTDAGNMVDGKLVYDNSRSPNYLLLNDGTGKLYAALHEQFADLGNQVIDYLKPMQQQADGTVDFFIGDDIRSAGIPKFVAYQAADGSIDYLAEVSVGYWQAPGTWANKYLFVNVPLHYDPTTDFSEDVTIADRNGSMLMRTWAGDDVFTDVHANAAPAHIDGGLGFDTARYGGAFGDYALTRQADGAFVVATRAGAAASTASVHDTLVNVEQLRFADVAVSLALDGSDAQAYRIYQAAFDRAPDLVGLGFWMAQMRSGTSLHDVAAGFMQSEEFGALYGAAPTPEEFVARLYANILHRAPEQGGYDFWVGQLHADGSPAFMADVLAAISESAENQLQVIGAIQDGIAFAPWG